MGIRSLLADRLPLLRASDTLADRASYSRDSWQRTLVQLSVGQSARSAAAANVTGGQLPGGGSLPSAVCWPENTQQVASIVDLAREQSLELVPFGAGSGVCGGVAGGERTLVVDLKRMADHELLAEGPEVSVGPGATGITLEREIEQHGFTIGHFPSSIICSTVGGWVAARGAGQCSSRYGKVEDMVQSAECVLGNGRVVTFKRRSGELDLLPLMIGSEGALGFVTRVGLRLNQLPAARVFLAFRMSSGKAGMAALRRIMQDNLRPSVARLYDALDTLLMRRSSRGGHEQRGAEGGGLRRLRKRAIQKLLSNAALLNSGVNLLEKSPFGDWLLLLIFEGDGAHDDAERARRLVKREGGEDVGEAPARRWYEHRYAVSFQQIPVFRAGAFDDTMEVAAPWSRFEELFATVREALTRHVLVLAHISHAYPDGCSVYFTFGIAPGKGSSMLEIYDSAWRDALAAVHEAGGAISHHHGIGRSKALALERDLGPGADVLRRVLRAWDPARVMNPGALLPLVPGASASERRYPDLGLDELSQLVTVEASRTLGELESELQALGFTLNAAAPAADMTVADWLARGLPGAADPWSDPVDHTLAGLQAMLHDGKRFTLLPLPRRATGPDLAALVVGAGGRIARLERATLRVRPLHARSPRPLPFAGERKPAVSAEERAAFDDLVSALRG